MNHIRAKILLKRVNSLLFWFDICYNFNMNNRDNKILFVSIIIVLFLLLGVVATFIIINKNQHQHVFFAVFLFHGRRQKIILRIIVDHGLCQDLVRLRISRCIFQLTFHKSRNLIHIQINIGNIRRFDILNSAKAFHNAV